MIWLADREWIATFNAIEALWWIWLAVFVEVYWKLCAGLTPTLRDVTAVLRFSFGISDLIEIRTGAWWRPAGMFVLKGICVVGLLSCGVMVLRNRRIRRDQ